MNEFAKRLFDILFSTLALFLLMPMGLAIYLYMFINYGPPVFFVHSRIGKDGRIFKCLKFRTMILNAEDELLKLFEKNPKLKNEFYKDFKLKDDPRILGSMGHFLRKTSLDELPQIFNIIKGEMSIVGPRPIVEEEIKRYGSDYQKLVSVRPGLTGLWQVGGRNDISYQDRVSLDMYYINNNNIFMDVLIIIKTLKVILYSDGAY